MKGNGAVNSLSSTLHLVDSGGLFVHNCTIDVLYKGTTKEEEGFNPVGVYAPSTIGIDSYGAAHSSGTSGSIKTFTYDLVIPGDTGYKPNFAIEQLIMCVLPNSTSGLFTATTPVVFFPYITGGSYGTQGLGHYSLTNNCMTVNSAKENFGVVQNGDVLHFNAMFPSVATYDGSEFNLIVFGRVAY